MMTSTASPTWRPTSRSRPAIWRRKSGRKSVTSPGFQPGRFSPVPAFRTFGSTRARSISCVKACAREAISRLPFPPPFAGEGRGGVSLVLARLVGEFVRIGLAEVGVLALEARNKVLLDTQHGLRPRGRHLAVGAEDGQLVLKRGDVQVLARYQVVRGHLGGDLCRGVRLHPLERLDVDVDQPLGHVLVAV